MLNRPHLNLRIASTFLALFFVLGAATAQVQTGTITGTVLDPRGNAVPDAKVAVRDAHTGTEHKAASNQSGEFTIPGLPFGTYSVTVEAPGFAKWETTNVEVVTAQQAIVMASLAIGAVTQTVTVEAAQTQLNTVSAELQTNVTRKQILDLPTAGRNPVDFAALQAGVTGGTGTRTSVVNGLRGSTNNITQDGVNVQDNFIRSDGFFANSAPTVENTGEFSITTQNSASDSGAGVAQVRMTTPRGTNDFHGSAFYYHRNDAFGANTFTNNLAGTAKDRLRQHRFGGHVGGPVHIPKLYNGHDKTFFFFSYEGFRENFQQTRNRTVLTQSARQGSFQYNAGSTVQTVNLFSPTVNTRGFPTNPFMQSLIGATPLPNNNIVGDGFNTGGFQFNVPGSDPSNRFSIRSDQDINTERFGNHRVEVDWYRAHFTTFPDTFNSNEASFPPGIAANCTGAVCLGAGQTSTRKVLAVALHSSLTPTVFNEFRVGYSPDPVTFDREAAFPRAFQVRLPLAQGSTTTPFITNPELNFLNQGRTASYLVFIDNLSRVWRTHTFKMGFLISSTSADTFNDASLLPFVQLGSNAGNSDGVCTSPACFPGASAATTTRAQQILQTLVGLRGTVTQRFNATPGVGFVPGATNANLLRERAYNFYFSDSWRVKPKLTLSYGLRYELVPAVDQLNKRAILPVNGVQDLFFSGPLFQVNPSVTFNDLLNGRTTKLDVAGASNDKPFWNTAKKNFAPSVGVAWQPMPKTVIRSSFSLSYVRDGLQVVSNALGGDAGLINDVQTLPNSTSPGGGSTLDSSASQAQTTPQFSLPIDQKTNFLSNIGNALFTFDPNLATPYALQWSFGVERELSPSTVFELRYVGNHAVKLYRDLDVGQINLTGDLVNEFNAAKNNLAICRATTNCTSGFRSAGLPNQQALPNLTAAGASTGMKIPVSFFANSTFVNFLDTNAAGDFWYTMQGNCTLNFLNGASCLGLGTYPANFFVANPIAAAGDIVGNGSSSVYHGLQVEVRRRLSRTIGLQGNYTFGKVLTNSSGASTEFDPGVDLRHPDYDKTRATFDIRHTFHFNGIWEFPIGRGQRWANSGVLGKVLEGWQVGSIWTWRSGRPTSILSERGTVNRGAARSAGRNAAVPVGMTAADVCASAGIYETGNGAFWLPDKFYSFSGQNVNGANSALLTNPAAGSLGTQHLYLGCSGPGFNQIDMNFIKRTLIKEKMNVEFRAEFFNLLNHPNFLVAQGSTTTQNPNINNPGFGLLNSNSFTSREIEFNLRLNF